MSAHNLVTMFLDVVSKHGLKSALMVKKDGSYQTITYQEFAHQVSQFALGLASLGIVNGDRIALISENRPEWPIADLGILALGAVNVPLYTTLTAAQIQYILDDSQARLIIASGPELVEQILSIRNQLPHLQAIVYMDAMNGDSLELISFHDVLQRGKKFAAEHPDYFARAVENVKNDDLCGIIYTSGTTGAPKGVMLSHGNILSNVHAGLQVLHVTPEDRLLSFLPLCHSFERMAGQFSAICAGATIAYAESIETIARNMLEVKPTVVTTVPRVLEKIHVRVLEQVESGSAVKRKIFHWSMKVGEQMVHARRTGRISSTLRMKHSLANRLVFRKLQQRVGGRLRFFLSGGAPLSKSVAEFLFNAGILTVEGYGLTESSPVITANSEDNFRFGAVGRPIPGVEVRIADDGEILTRGPHVMKGYYRNPEATREAIDKDGWLHTGDIGYIDDDGFLVITDRKKNIIVTSGGKNVTPAAIEQALITSRYIEQAMVVGDAFNYLTALIVPAFDAVRSFLKDKGINPADNRTLVDNEDVKALIQQQVSSQMVNFARFERIKKFILLPAEFTQESGELTPTLKLRRKHILQKYQAEIEAMYQSGPYIGV